LKIIGIIPARFQSSRFPGKPLVDLAGKPMIQWVWEQAKKARSLDAVLVATDDARIAKVVRSFGGEAVMTPVSCATGTDRIALAARKYNPGIVVNIQGDEPLLPPSLIDQLVTLLLKNPSAAMATLCHPFMDQAEWRNPNVVKIAMDLKGQALYFSRSPIPFPRNVNLGAHGHAPLRGNSNFAKHIGLYAYRAWFLREFTRLKPTPLEKLECLEQLRALENGYAIQVGWTKHTTIAVDTPRDAAAARKILKSV
jgi:3-deoxy-manno-octulosonate cytidylyltransferase (CMP-KDO synthetase)